MKIAVFHELHNGGAKRAVTEIGRHLKETDVVDLYVSGQKPDKEEKASFRRVYSFPFASKVWRRGDWLTKLYKDTYEYVKLLNHHKKIAEKLNKGNYDLVFIHPSQFTQAPFILLFVKATRIYYCQEPLRIVYDKALNDLSHIHGARKAYELAARTIRRVIDRVNLSRADYIFCNSEFSKDSIKKAYGVKAKVEYLGVDHKFFKPSKAAKRVDILYFGSHERIEMYELFKNAIKGLPKRINIQEHFPGHNWVSDESLRKMYQESKLVVTLHKNEPFGLIPIEAASCGTVTIALDSGGHKESIIDGKTGFLVAQDQSVLTKRMLSFLANDAKRKLMESQARMNVISNWTWEVSVKRIRSEMLKIYEKTS